jgi:D-alanyl-lipoteichoic acid acyltransferase DltB (MBOAT superfamily)
MGAWHQLSLHYVLWGTYHAAGILLCRLLQRSRGMAPAQPGASAMKSVAWSASARLATFAWLAASAPVVKWLLDALGSAAT